MNHSDANIELLFDRQLNTFSLLLKGYFEMKIWAIHLPDNAVARIYCHKRRVIEVYDFLGVLFVIDSFETAAQMKASIQSVSFLILLNSILIFLHRLL